MTVYKEKFSDHINIWRDELKEWMPEKIFDAHVHLGTSEGLLCAFSEERRKLIPIWIMGQ